jgi:hypothetical protein
LVLIEKLIISPALKVMIEKLFQVVMFLHFNVLGVPL